MSVQLALLYQRLDRQSAETTMGWRIGVDSGGTFTDICLFDESSGRIAVWKVSSTPANPSQAVADGLGDALARIGVRATSRFSVAGRQWQPKRSFDIRRTDRFDHQRRLPPPARNRPTKTARPLRSAGGQTARARRAPAASRGAGTAAPRWPRRNPARPGQPAPRQPLVDPLSRSRSLQPTA